MKYEKAITKLEKFNDLSKEKQMKLLKKILTDEEIVKWQFDPTQNKQPYSGEMFNKLYKAMAMPSALRTYEPMDERYGKETFTRSSIVILHTVLSYALEIHNNMIDSYKAEVRESGNNAETKDLKNRVEKYAEHLDSMKNVIQKLIKPYLKKLSAETSLSRDMVFKALMVAPEVKYIPQQRITPTTIHLLEELYSEANVSGFPARGAGVNWSPLFKTIFGVENIPSVAVSILLEGAHHIDKYRDSDNLICVRDCWDSLTRYALDELEKAPDKVRGQMMELYLKKAENLINRRNGRPTDLRVNLTRLPSEFRNLIRTVDFYKNQFDTISGKVRYATGKNNRTNPEPIKEPVVEEDKGVVDTVLDTAHTVADALEIFE